MKTLWFLAVQVCLLTATDGANILAFFPFPAKSHHILFKPWILELCKRGHKITYLSPHQYDENDGNLEKIPFPDYWAEQNNWLVEYRKNNTPLAVANEIGSLLLAMYGLANDTLRSPNVAELLKSNRRYDVVITEAFFYHEWTTAFAHRFNALSIVIQTFGGHAWTNEMSGLPDNPSYMFDLRYNKAEPPSNILETLYNIFTTICTVGPSYYFLSGPQQNLIDKLVRYPGWENRPRLTMIAADNALVLRNTHHSVGHPWPTAPHVKDVGGLNVDFDFHKKPKVMGMPKFAEYKKFMDQSTQGFIYFSLGSLVKPVMLPSGTFEKLYSAFSKLKQNVLMRWNGNDKPATPSENVKLYNEFLPQLEILDHKNIKGFVTHGGLLSQMETIYFAVPVLGLPIFGDQPMNARRSATQGYGLTLDIMEGNVNEVDIVNAVNELIINPKYKAEAERRSRLFKDRSMAPVDEAVYWTEYVIKQGKVLQPASVRMPFYQVYLLDVLASIAAATITIGYLMKWTMRYIHKMIHANPKHQANRKLKKN